MKKLTRKQVRKKLLFPEEYHGGGDSSMFIIFMFILFGHNYGKAIAKSIKE